MSFACTVTVGFIGTRAPEHGFRRVKGAAITALERLTAPIPPDYTDAMWFPGHGWICLLPGPTSPQTHLAPRCPTGHDLSGEAPFMPDGTCRACWNEQALRGAA